MLTAAQPRIPAGPWGVSALSTQDSLQLAVVLPISVYGRDEVSANAVLTDLSFWAGAATTYSVVVLITDGVEVTAKSAAFATSGAGWRTVSGLSLPLPASYGFGIWLPTAQSIGVTPLNEFFGSYEQAAASGSAAEPNVGTSLSAAFAAGAVSPSITASGYLA